MEERGGEAQMGSTAMGMRICRASYERMIDGGKVQYKEDVQRRVGRRHLRGIESSQDNDVTGV